MIFLEEETPLFTEICGAQNFFVCYAEFTSDLRLQVQLSRLSPGEFPSVLVLDHWSSSDDEREIPHDLVKDALTLMHSK